jgi:uncharacterized protein (UPF0216 family)
MSLEMNGEEVSYVFDYNQDDVAIICRRISSDYSLNEKDLSELCHMSVSMVRRSLDGSDNSFILLQRLSMALPKLQIKCKSKWQRKRSIDTLE